MCGVQRFHWKNELNKYVYRQIMQIKLKVTVIPVFLYYLCLFL